MTPALKSEIWNLHFGVDLCRKSVSKASQLLFLKQTTHNVESKMDRPKRRVGPNRRVPPALGRGRPPQGDLTLCLGGGLPIAIRRGVCMRHSHRAWGSTCSRGATGWGTLPSHGSTGTAARRPQGGASKSRPPLCVWRENIGAKKARWQLDDSWLPFYLALEKHHGNILVPTPPP